MANPLEGHWINPANSVVILVEPCERSYCGRVVWASDEAKADAARGSGRLMGTRLLWDVRPQGANRWKARLYIPDAKREVEGRIQLLRDGRMEITGCVLLGTVCRSQVWSPVLPVPGSVSN
ncbi:DUF2147 domain-containing protein [Sphingomicrobium aquimarinum]|uniref:DUF2147 domain-containing protein n=1 Tax=Sphingomicrobium aquimarinum TaxID=3133971 RepID=UPI003D75EA9A